MESCIRHTPSGSCSKPLVYTFRLYSVRLLLFFFGVLHVLCCAYFWTGMDALEAIELIKKERPDLRVVKFLEVSNRSVSRLILTCFSVVFDQGRYSNRLSYLLLQTDCVFRMGLKMVKTRNAAA